MNQTRNVSGGLVDGMRDASGQIYMRNRYYDPATGQFTQTDPIGLAGGLNAYGFAAGDPVSYSDPYGLSPDTVKAIGATSESIISACRVSPKCSKVLAAAESSPHTWTIMDVAPGGLAVLKDPSCIVACTKATAISPGNVTTMIDPSMLSDPAVVNQLIAEGVPGSGAIGVGFHEMGHAMSYLFKTSGVGCLDEPCANDFMRQLWFDLNTNLNLITRANF